LARGLLKNRKVVTRRGARTPTADRPVVVERARAGRSRIQCNRSFVVDPTTDEHKATQ